MAMTRKSKIMILLLLLLNSAMAVAQRTAVYPLQLNVQLLPPYSTCINDYVSGGYNQLRVTALQRDMSHLQYDMVLSLMILKDNNVILQNDINKAGVIRLKPNTVTTVGSEAIKSLMDADNLIRSRMSNDGSLPEGYYEFRLQAFAADNRSLPVSMSTSTFAYLSNNAVPLLIYPSNGDCVDSLYGSVNFSWMDATPSLRSDKLYDFYLYELHDSTQYDNYAGISNSQSTIANARNLITPFFTVLKDKFQYGHRYAWKVRVHSRGNSNSAGYVNDGFSEVNWFEWTNCNNSIVVNPKDKEVKISKKDTAHIIRVDTLPTSAMVVWLKENKYVSYIVSYRRKDTVTAHAWITIQVAASNSSAITVTDTTTVTDKDSSAGKDTSGLVNGTKKVEEDSTQLSNLSHDYEYEVFVVGVKQDGSHSLPSDTLTFKLPDLKSDDGCGTLLAAIKSKNKSDTLAVGTNIDVNGTSMIISSVNKNQDGTFSGEGVRAFSVMGIPLKLKVKFINITPNDSGEMKNGKVVSIYDPKHAATVDVNGLLNKGATGTVPQEAETYMEVLNKDSITETNYGKAYVDSSGNVYVVDDKGGTTAIGKKQDIKYETNGTITSTNGTIAFDCIDGQNTAKDEALKYFSQERFGDWYETIDGYNVPWLYVPTGVHKQIKAKMSDKMSVNKDSILFVCTGNIVLNSKYDEKSKSFIIDVLGGSENKRQCVYAVVKNGSTNLKTVGKVNIANYAQKNINVVFIPLDGSNININTNSIAETLKKIYAPVGVNVSVTEDESYKNISLNSILPNGLKVEGASNLTSETEDMQKLRRLYRDSTLKGNIGENTAYLFVLKENNNDNVLGLMPRSNRFGYIFIKDNSFDNGRLTAHMIAHGLFNLEHTFGTYSVTRASTNNLMDLDVEGSFLTVWQWDLIHTASVALWKDKDEYVLETKK